jgi:membrane protein
MFRFLTIVSQLFLEAGNNWLNDRGPRLGAALAFYSALSIAPLLVITISVGSLLFGEAATRQQVLEQAEDMVSEEGAAAIASMLSSADPKKGKLASVLGVAALILGASGIFAELQDGMNTVWHIQMTDQLNLWTFLRNRFLSFAMVLGTGFLLLVSLVISALIAGAANFLDSYWPGLGPLWQAANGVVSFGVVTLLFAMIFKVLPDAQVPWRDVWFGAALTAALFTGGKLFIALYLGTSGLGSAYGAAGSLVVLLVWVYFSAQILYFGAELTRVFTKRYERGVAPEEGAIYVKEETIPCADPLQDDDS